MSDPADKIEVAPTAFDMLRQHAGHSIELKEDAPYMALIGRAMYFWCGDCHETLYECEQEESK